MTPLCAIPQGEISVNVDFATPPFALERLLQATSKDEIMTDTTPTTQAPMTEQALLADRQSFWASFTSASTYAAVGVIVVVLAMWFFLV